MTTLSPIEGTFYKALLILPDSRRVSPWAGNPNTNDFQEIEYNGVGSVTLAPEGTAGISVSIRKLSVADPGCSLAKKRITDGRLVIHECTALGEYKSKGMEKGFATAIILGKVIEEEPEKPPEPSYKFKVGDRVQFKAETTRPTYGVDLRCLGQVGLVQEVREKGKDLEVNFPTVFNDSQIYDQVCLASEMEPAPKLKEEWVDVTKECVFTLLTAGSLAVEHKCRIVGHITLGTYKLEEVWYTDSAKGRYLLDTEPNIDGCCEGRPRIVVRKLV